MNILIEIVGWFGAALILAAYALLSSDRIEAKSRTYQWLNVIGAIALVVNGAWNGAYPSAALNAIWIGIGVYSLLRLRAAKSGKPV